MVTAPRRGLALLVVVAGLALSLASCGGDGDGEATTTAQPLGDVRVGSVAQLATCGDWLGGERDERLATIDDVREQINLQDSNVETPELSDEAAYRLFTELCTRNFASNFRLYKIYARATSFASFAQ